MNWKTPKHNIPELTSGMLVIESDDGNLGDYSIWYPSLKGISHKYSQWYPYNTAKGVHNINSANIGDDSGIKLKMKVEHLQELQRYGYEINSHGRHHISLGAQVIKSPATIGATEINVVSANKYADLYGLSHLGIYNFRIFEGVKSEVLNITGYIGEILQLGAPLQNNYTTAAKIQITEASAHEALQGCIDDLAAWGISCKHHAYTWHDGSYHAYSAEAVGWVASLFDSGRGSSGVTNPLSFNLAVLPSRGDGVELSAHDLLMDEVQANDGVLIYYGHGDAGTRLTELKYVATRAIERGIKIGTRTEAVNKLMGL